MTRRVSIHAPAWGATSTRSPSRSRSRSFNPRTRVGCDARTVSPSSARRRFQSTHPRGVRPAGVVEGVTDQLFQSTHPRGVRLVHGQTQEPGICSFNPRTRVGCDPAWMPITAPNGSFNPRTRVGCDSRPSAVPSRTTRFNPRTRVGCDAHRVHRLRRHGGFQSTHPRGVRPGRKDISENSGWFQSTHPRGVRRLLGLISGPAILFQSTHPRGVRPLFGGIFLRRFGSFNPRTRVGCDLRVRPNKRILFLFQSTHPRGVRLTSHMPAIQDSTVSIHAPAWGATMPFNMLPVTLQSFNPRTRVGCDDTLLLAKTCVCGVSIHAPV